MITITNAKFSHYAESGVAVNVYDIAGLSTDSKPVTEDVGNGSSFIEMNTSKVYFYDEANHQWREWGA